MSGRRMQITMSIATDITEKSGFATLSSMRHVTHAAGQRNAYSHGQTHHSTTSVCARFQGLQPIRPPHSSTAPPYATPHSPHPTPSHPSTPIHATKPTHSPTPPQTHQHTPTHPPTLTHLNPAIYPLHPANQPRPPPVTPSTAPTYPHIASTQPAPTPAPTCKVKSTGTGFLCAL